MSVRIALSLYRTVFLAVCCVCPWRMYGESLLSGDLQSQEAQYLAGAQAGDANSMFLLATFYLEHPGEFADRRGQALSNMRAAANAGHAEAMFVMAQLFEKGSSDLGVQADPVRAETVYRMLAGFGHAGAVERLKAMSTPNAATTVAAQMQTTPDPVAIRKEIANIGATIRELERKLRQRESDYERQQERELWAEKRGLYTGLATLKVAKYNADMKSFTLYEQRIKNLEKRRIELEGLLARVEAMQGSGANSSVAETPQTASSAAGVQQENAEPSTARSQPSERKSFKFCSECGARTDRVSKFCQECGHKF